MKRFLILCTGNRCRSQMAQGLLMALTASKGRTLGEDVEVFSAGIRPAYRVHPLAIKVMGEMDIDISTHCPKSVDQYLGWDWDYVITVCGGAKESCPVFLGHVGRRIHMGFDDPDAFKGSEEEILSEFRRVRDEILTGLKALLEREVPLWSHPE